MASSPSPSNNGDLLSHEFHHLLQHNANTSYPQENYGNDEDLRINHNFSSPAPSQDGSYAYRGHQQPRFQYQPQHPESGMGIQYESYQPDFHGSVYSDQYSTPATSPPTPSMSTQDMLRTRSGLGIQRRHQDLRPMPEGRSRIEKSPKPKRVKKEKVKAEKKVAKLDRPLSELTKDWKHVPVADIDTYVNRSAEDRRKEVDEGKIPGKVKRPMNSFMLYRKAYQNRTKDWCLQNNHQVVSQVCGDSWPLEPDAVKEQFSEWARIERINHQNAHPGYKFSPTKPGQAKASKRKQSEDLVTEESDLDDFDWQRGSNRRSKKSRQSQAPRIEQPVAYPTTKSAYQYSSREPSMDHERNYGGYNRSSYQATNPGRPLPAQYQHDLQAGEYYQQTIRPNGHNMIGTQDVILTKTAAPSVQSYLGLPGGQQDFAAMNQFAQYGNHQDHAPKQEIDPSLIFQGGDMYHDGNYDASHSGGVFFGDTQHHPDQKWAAPIAMIDPALGDPDLSYAEPEQSQDGGPIQDPHMNVLRGNQEGWHVESLDGGGEFDKWMEDDQ
ncbi:Transcription factor ste11 [Lachnellula suecica]|uniref:Transcription factor ste11 n=1 Tax=Lachnellula suecica TaxID=602035 RepID=A0A8T9CAI7_9HELO|nr:Transcription factor ste11 [Lachnellula suecica]